MYVFYRESNILVKTFIKCISHDIYSNFLNIYFVPDMNTLTRKIHHKNGTTIPIEIFVSYTNNPWGPSAMLEASQSGGGAEQYR